MRRLRSLRGNARELSVVVEQFVGGQIVVEVRLLGKKSDLRLDFRIGPFTAQDAGRSGGRKDQSHQHFQSRGFAGAVRAKEAEDLAFFDGQMQRLQGALGPLAPESHHVGFFETEDFNCWPLCQEPTCKKSFPKKIISKTTRLEDGAGVTTVTQSALKRSVRNRQKE